MNATPSLRFDPDAGDRLFGSRLTPPGFYYKTFIRPRRLWPLYEKILRHAAGLGRLPRRQAERRWRTEYRRRHADVLVIGGGVAGMSAALRAAELGADVVLVDDGPELGGVAARGRRCGRARAIGASVRDAGIEVLAPAAAIGFFDGLVPVWCRSTLHQVRARTHITATGSIEQPLMFEGNDLPGVMLCSGAQRLAALYGVLPGKRGVVATTSDRGLECAVALGCGGRGRCRGRRRASRRGRLTGCQRGSKGRGSRCCAARRGQGVRPARVKGTVVAPSSAMIGRPEPETERGLDCDLVAVSGGSVPSASLLLQAGAKAKWDQASGAYIPGATPPGIYAAGAVAGHESAARAEASGAIAGTEAALSLWLREGAGPAPGLAAERRGPGGGRARRRDSGRAAGRRRAPAAVTGSASPASARTSPRMTSTFRSTRDSTRWSS